MTLQNNLKVFKDYINYKTIIVGLVVFFVSCFIMITSFEQYTDFTGIITGFLLIIQLSYMTENTKEYFVNFLIIAVIGYLVVVTYNFI